MPAWNMEVGIVMIIIGALVLLGLYLFGRPKKPDQVVRHEDSDDAQSPAFARTEPRISDPSVWDDAEPSHNEAGDYREPYFDHDDSAIGEPQGDFFGAAETHDDAMEDDATTVASDDMFVHDEEETAQPQAPQSTMFDGGYEKIITVFISARANEMFQGSDILVAAEKVGLVLGDLNIFHRFEGEAGQGKPVCSVANILNPGFFDIGNIQDVETPGLTVFMTLPGPLSALDAWDIMLPMTERLAELLDGMVLDADRNTLGRQRVAHLRDELRAWDREQEKKQSKTRGGYLPRW